mmetsp:Transcript_30830/g.89677  ORF Transcript_30830/g.89677 Transcript_30830/m.89677 type:complete len:92 (-) Transcript_30830:2105-2380(-)
MTQSDGMHLLWMEGESCVKTLNACCVCIRLLSLCACVECKTLVLNSFIHMTVACRVGNSFVSWPPPGRSHPLWSVDPKHQPTGAVRPAMLP